jgi:GNAT superfamily N-acetyltransferase
VAVQDPPPQQPPTHPQVQRLIDAAQVGATVQAAGAATVAPGVAVALPAVAAAEIVSVPAEALAHGIKIALILRVLRRLLRRHRTENLTALEKMLRKEFPDLDPAAIRRIVEQEIKYEDAFARKSTQRVENDMQAVGQLQTAEKQAKRIQEILAREAHYSALREQAMLARARQRAHNETVRMASPDGAKWVLGAAKNHTLGCLALAGKNWPWEVLDTIPPPLHTNCQCSLQPLGPNDTVPPAGEAMAMARRAIALEEAITAVADPGEIEACLVGEPVRPCIERALAELQEATYKEGLHPRGRGGKWITKLGKPKLKLKPSYEEQGGFSGKNLTQRQVHSAVKKVAEGVVDFYGGDKQAVEAHHEPEYLAANSAVARFHHPGERLAGINYGQEVVENVRSPDMGLFGLRQIAHEAAHSLSGTRPGPLPGFSQHFEEGGAEILSLWFWHHRAQELDHRDATKRTGAGWTDPGDETLAHSVVYRDWVEEFMRRAASKVGWDRTAIVDEVERVMRGDHTVRLRFRDATDPQFGLPTDLPEGAREIGRDDEGDHAVALMKWLMAGSPAHMQEAEYTERLHPRDRLGKFSDVLGRLHTLTRSEVEGGHVPGLHVAGEAEGVAGRAFTDRGIRLAPSAFDKEGRVSSVLVAHEAGHYLVNDIIKDGKVPPELEAFHAGTGRAAGRYGAVAGGGAHLFTNPWKADERDLPEEMLADAYSALLHGEGEFRYVPGLDGPDDPESREQARQEFEANRKTKLLRLVAQAAREAGWPDKALYRWEASGPMDKREYRLVLRESFFDAVLHPRGRGGQWVDAIHHAERDTAPAERDTGQESFTGEDFAKAMDGFSHGGITAMRSNRTQTQRLFGEVWLNLHKPGGSAPVGLARVTLKPPNNRGERVAELSNIYLNEAEQGHGFGRAFTDHLLKTLRENGVDRIDVEAVSVGGYAWARRGFVWSADHAAEQRRILQDAKNDGRWEHIKNWPGADELERKLLAGEFTSEAELAAFGVPRWTATEQPQDQMTGYTQPERERTWLGRELLIGSRWKGSRPVTVQAQDVR